MEFATFREAVVAMPCKVVPAGGWLIHRLRWHGAGVFVEDPGSCALRSDRPKHRRTSLLASVSSDRSRQRVSPFG
jgi:hypothetical protein